MRTPAATIAARSGAWVLALLALALAGAFAPGARADEIRPALLQIDERGDGLVDVLWKLPARGDMVPRVQPGLPSVLVPLTAPVVSRAPGAQVQRTTFRAPPGALVGERIAVDGLGAFRFDVLLQLQLADGTHHSAILRAGESVFVVPARAGKMEVARDYLRLGFVHILEGADHLLFVLGLLLLVSGAWRLVKTITAFTIAHSITLSLATLDILTLPAQPTEAIIALSIVFLATEILRRRVDGSPGLTERWPWLIAFGFGLFHGLGFAGVLAELGVPQHEVPLALLAFNIGVEAGQLVFVGAVLVAMAALRALRLPRLAWGRVAIGYVVGGVAAFWTIERVVQSVGLAA